MFYHIYIISEITEKDSEPVVKNKQEIKLSPSYIAVGNLDLQKYWKLCNHQITNDNEKNWNLINYIFSFIYFCKQLKKKGQTIWLNYPCLYLSLLPMNKTSIKISRCIRDPFVDIFNLWMATYYANGWRDKGYKNLPLKYLCRWSLGESDATWIQVIS